MDPTGGEEKRHSIDMRARSAASKYVKASGIVELAHQRYDEGNLIGQVKSGIAAFRARARRVSSGRAWDSNPIQSSRIRMRSLSCETGKVRPLGMVQTVVRPILSMRHPLRSRRW